ncbi:MAG: hypothetical protein KJ749_00785 [Planctomycetes bacterium]|nr:hypothetical protein [Planctomycetota bacterium]
MNSPPLRFLQVRWLHNLTCALGVLGGLVAIVIGVLGGDISANAWLIVAGGFLLLFASGLITIVPLLLAIEAGLSRQVSELREVQDGLNRHSASLQAIAENTAISDATKAVAHREQELRALQNVIREEIRSQRWEAATNLVEEIEKRFGLKGQANDIRVELEQARGEAIRARLAEAIKGIEALFRAHEWDRAQAEIDRLRTALPGNATVASLAERMQAHREQHKQELKVAWEEAIRRSDTDQAIEILRELDQYLTPAEAHTLQSSARHVFKEKLLQLGVQFRFAVTEKRWADALMSGLQLVREFPNARMANEVRAALDTLRERAGQQASAGATKAS